MAHVKVVRRSMRPEEWTDLRFVWLQRGIYEDKFEITDLEIRDARQISEDQYEYYSDEYRPLKKDLFMKYVCDVCGWEYDEEQGYPEGGIAPGTKWEDVPEDFECPLCSVGKDQFSQE